MITVLLNWLYIAITSFVTGFAVLSFFSFIFGVRNKGLLPQILAGLVLNTVYAQVWSLFGGVGFAANVVLLIAVVMIVLTQYRKISALIKKSFDKVKNKQCLFALYGVTVLLFAYGTSRGYIHYDTSLYHAQSIRWIEEYGVVKGLACLQLRFGYNSAAFALNALYSFVWLCGQSLHTTAGFFALLGAIQVLDVVKVFETMKVRYSDFIRLGLLFYLGLIFDQMTSPASDYYAQILIYTVLILWLDALDEQEKRGAYPFAMISILLCFAATIKFSIALLVLLVIKPAVMMIKKKQLKQIIVSLCGGIIVLMPFLIRNVIISGWLIYPSTLIDLFDVKWKIPKGVAQYDAMEIGLYGRGITDVTQYNIGLTQWLPGWFLSMTFIEKMWVSLTVIYSAAAVGYFFIMLIKRKTNFDRLLVFAVLMISCIFWFLNAPLVRYGYGYLTCIPLLVDSYLCFELVRKKDDNEGSYSKSLYIAFVLIFVVFGLYRAKTIGYNILMTAKEPYYVVQKDYIDWPAQEHMLDGQVIYIPVQDALIGYNQFPASLLTIDVTLLGDDYSEGFAFKDYQGFLDEYNSR